MPEPISEQITAMVAERLSVLTVVDDEDDGFETIASQVYRPTRLNKTFEASSFTIIVSQGDIGRDDSLMCPGNPPAIAWVMPVKIVGVIRESEEDEEPNDTLKNRFWSDVVRALTVPEATWHDWEGLAINSTISGVTNLDSGEGESTGFQLTLTVTFRTSEVNPYEVH